MRAFWIEWFTVWIERSGDEETGGRNSVVGRRQPSQPCILAHLALARVTRLFPCPSPASRISFSRVAAGPTRSRPLCDRLKCIIRRSRCLPSRPGMCVQDMRHDTTIIFITYRAALQIRIQDARTRQNAANVHYFISTCSTHRCVVKSKQSRQMSCNNHDDPTAIVAAAVMMRSTSSCNRVREALPSGDFPPMRRPSIP